MLLTDLTELQAALEQTGASAASLSDLDRGSLAVRMTRRDLLAMAGIGLPLSLSSTRSLQAFEGELEPFSQRRYLTEQFILQPGPIQVSILRPRSVGLYPCIVILDERAIDSPAFIRIAEVLVGEGMMVALPDLSVMRSDAVKLSEPYSNEIPSVLPESLDMLLHHLVHLSAGSIGILAANWGASLTIPMLAGKSGGSSNCVKGAVFFDFVVSDIHAEREIRVPIQMHVAGLDRHSMLRIAKGEKHMIAEGKRFELYVYPGLSPSFAMDPVLDSKTQQATDLALMRVARFFNRTVISSGMCIPTSPEKSD